MKKFRKVIEIDSPLKKKLTILAAHKEVSLDEYINIVLTNHTKTK